MAYRIKAGGVTLRYDTVDDMRAALRQLDQRANGRSLTGDETELWNGIVDALDQHDIRTRQIEHVERAYAAGNGGEPGATFHTARPDHGPASSPPEYRDEALRTLEEHADALGSTAGDRLDNLVRRHDPAGVDARYLAAVADSNYLSAFGKLLTHDAMASLRMTPDEIAAVQEVNAAEAMRAMAIGDGATGGFAIPFTLDPTIIPTDNYALTSVRDFARVETISTNEWRGVSSQGVTAAYQPEATEVGDDSPTLAQPTVTAAKAQGFVPFSIEVDQDWTSLQAELAQQFMDAKYELEADKFLTGDGTDEPSGILTGATVMVTGAGSGAFAVADVYSLVQAVPPRFQPNIAVAASPNVFDFAYQAVGGGSTEPPVLPTREGPILGRRKFEWSNMQSTIAQGNKVMVAGDWRYFLIADRVGASAELVPHLFGTNHRPTGQRGLYFFWRNGSGVLSANAFRVLVIR